MAGITLAKALSVFASELGCGDTNDRERLIDEVVNGIEWVLFNGGGSLLREWEVTVRNGRFTFPRDLETPIKFKFSKYADQGFGTINSPYYSYGSQGISNCCGYSDWETHLSVRANKVATQFYLPATACGLRLVATTRNDLDAGKKLVVGGKQRGFPITGIHNGFKTSGELLTIYMEDDSDKNYSSYEFDEVTSVVKELTCDYVMLSGVDSDGTFYHIGHYHPDEEVASYVEGEVFGCSCWNSFNLGAYVVSCDYTLHILGRVNPSVRYIRDEDILPLESFEMLKLLAKRARYDESGDFQESNMMEQRLKVLIKRQVAYQQKANRQLSVNLAASGLTLSNL